MDFFTNCSRECCVCKNGNGCIAGHGDYGFVPATDEQIIERLKNGEYHCYQKEMIEELKKRGYIFK